MNGVVGRSRLRCNRAYIMTEHFTVNLVVWNIVPVRALYRLYRGRQFWKWLVIPNWLRVLLLDLGPVFRQALFRQALFRQAVFQYGTIPPTRLFNYQFLILVYKYKQMFTITSFALLLICWNYFVSTKSIRYFSIRHNQWRRKQFESGGTWRARSASV